MESLAEFSSERELPRVSSEKTAMQSTAKMRNSEGMPVDAKNVCLRFMKKPPFCQEKLPEMQVPSDKILLLFFHEQNKR